MAILQYILAIILAFVTTIVLYFKWTYGYWRRRNIPYIEPSFPMGNFENPLFMKKGFDKVLDEACLELRSKGRKYGGIYFLFKPILVVVDPDLAKLMLGKDFQHFRNRGTFIDEEIDPLSSNLLSLEDDKWKTMRSKLSPTFTSGKMKIMFDAILSCSDQLMEHMTDLTSRNQPMDVNEVISCFGTDVIGTCAFGIECNSFKNPDAEFRKYGKKVSEPSLDGNIGIILGFIVPELNKVFKKKVFQDDVTEFFTNAFKTVADQRTATNLKRNDFVQLLLDINAGHSQESAPFSFNEMVAQAFLFFVAGFSTTATNLSFCLYELALQPEIQQKLREEVLEVLKNYGDQVTYDSLADMKYMDQVIDETLRKYPSVAILIRKCSKAYPIPGTDTIIEKGTSVFINVRSLQMDDDYFPNPEKFDPERFSKENKAKMHPYAFIPFGDGPRVCIGKRFAIMQIKIGLSLILKNFKVLPDETTPNPVKFSSSNIGSWIPEKPILLKTELYNTPL